MKFRYLVRFLGKGLALFILSSLVMLGGMEAALRIAGVGSDQFLEQSPILGVQHIPSKRGTSQGSCFRATVTINSHGWRSRETPWKKPDDVFRIVILGDSFMAAHQVEDDETFAAVIEEELNGSNPPKRIEAINLGVPSFGNDQEYLALRHFGREYNPDFVVLAFYSQNDVSDNSMALTQRYSLYPKPFFVIEQGELLEIPFRDPTPPLVRIVRQLVQPLRLYPWVRDRLMRIPIMHRILFELGIVGVVPTKSNSAVGPGRYPSRWEEQSSVFIRHYDSEWESAWKITRTLLLRIQAEAEDMGAGFLIVGLSDPLAVSPRSVLSSELPTKRIATLDTDKPNKILKEFTAATGMNFFSLIPAFRTHIGESEKAFANFYLPCDGHWTVAGHRLAAETVTAYLAPIIKDRINN